MTAGACLLSGGPGSFQFLLPAVHSSAKRSRPARPLHGQKHYLNMNMKKNTNLNCTQESNRLLKITFATLNINL